MEPKSLVTNIPNIDQIFEEGKEPTEEEWKIWAENFKLKKITERKAEHEVLLKKRNAKVVLHDKERKKREYKTRKETGHKSWGKKYNDKRKYLYKYNEEYRELKKTESQIRLYKKSVRRYEYWVNVFRKKYKGKLEEHASTFKLREDVYVYGFTYKQLKDIGPWNANYFAKFRDEFMFPPAKYEGYRFKNNKLSKDKEPFYILTEAIEYFGVFDKNNSKIGWYTEEKKAYLKKKFWMSMLKAREEFENE